jgi:ABC-2 type transport system permease protein
MTASKYLAFARIGVRQALSERGELFGRAAFFVVMLGVFSALWRAVDRLPGVASAEQLVWYLAATEWIFFSAPQLHTEVQEEVRRGDVELRAMRPVSYPGALCARAFGALCVRAPVLGLVALATGYGFTGMVPSASQLASTSVLGALGSALLASFYVTLGILAFWLGDVSPLFWLWQKALFVLGGLMLPLSLYPEWFGSLAEHTPFAAILYFPASFLLTSSNAGFGLVLGQLLSWGALSAVFLHWLFQRARGALARGG